MIAIIGTGSPNSYELLTHSILRLRSRRPLVCQQSDQHPSWRGQDATKAILANKMPSAPINMREGSFYASLSSIRLRYPPPYPLDKHQQIYSSKSLDNPVGSSSRPCQEKSSLFMISFIYRYTTNSAKDKKRTEHGELASK